jgi:hypothetical protein
LIFPVTDPILCAIKWVMQQGEVKNFTIEEQKRRRNFPKNEVESEIGI